MPPGSTPRRVSGATAARCMPPAFTEGQNPACPPARSSAGPKGPSRCAAGCSTRPADAEPPARASRGPNPPPRIEASAPPGLPPGPARSGRRPRPTRQRAPPPPSVPGRSTPPTGRWPPRPPGSPPPPRRAFWDARRLEAALGAAKAAPACDPDNRSNRTPRARPELADASQVEDLRAADGGHAAFDIGGGPPAPVGRSVGLAAEKERIKEGLLTDRHAVKETAVCFPIAVCLIQNAFPLPAALRNPVKESTPGNDPSPTGFLPVPDCCLPPAATSAPARNAPAFRTGGTDRAPD